MAFLAPNYRGEEPQMLVIAIFRQVIETNRVVVINLLTDPAQFDIHDSQLIDINIDLGVAGPLFRGM
jgi:hypothetical protein